MSKRNDLFRMSLPFLAALIAFRLVCSGAEKTIAIKGGTVLTMAGKTIPNGIVLIKGEKIQAVGDSVLVPAEAEVIDAAGKYVMPGIIDAMTYFGVRPFDLNDTSNPVTPQNRIIQAYYPFGTLMKGRGGIEPDKEILSGGVTTVYIAPGDKQVIGGQGAVVKTSGPSFDRLVLREPAAIDMAIGDPPKAAFGESQKSPVTRMSITALIRKSLVDAQEYDRTLKAYEAKPAEEKKKTPRPPRDLNMEALAKLLNREIPARIESDLTDDLRTAIRVADEFKFDLVIDSGLTAYAIKDILAQKRIPVVLGPTSHPFVSGGEVSSTPELLRVMDEHNAALLTKAGVKIAIASFGFGFGGFGDAVQGKWLLLEAALATGFDLPDEEALKAVTINAAQILGVADRVGSLEPGKDADVIILDGYPLNVKTWVDKVFVNGEMVFSKK